MLVIYGLLRGKLNVANIYIYIYIVSWFLRQFMGDTLWCLRGGAALTHIAKTNRFRDCRKSVWNSIRTQRVYLCAFQVIQALPESRRIWVSSLIALVIPSEGNKKNYNKKDIMMLRWQELLLVSQQQQNTLFVHSVWVVLSSIFLLYIS